MREGVDYVVLDIWPRHVTGPRGPIGDELADAVRSSGHVVKVIGYQYPVWTEVWKLDRK
jgi:hypothetical protein